MAKRGRTDILPISAEKVRNLQSNRRKSRENSWSFN